MSADCIHIRRTTYAADRYIIHVCFFSVIYTYTHVYTYMHEIKHIHAIIYIYRIFLYIYIYIHHDTTHTQTHIYIYIYIYIYLFTPYHISHLPTYIYIYIYIFSHHIIYHIYPLKTASRPHWDSPSPGDELRSNLVRDAFEYLGLKAAPAWNDRRRLTARRLGGFCCGDLEGILAIRK